MISHWLFFCIAAADPVQVPGNGYWRGNANIFRLKVGCAAVAATRAKLSIGTCRPRAELEARATKRTVTFVLPLLVDQLQLGSAGRELLALGQLQVGPGFFRGESVRKTHRSPAEAADAIAAEHAQTLKMKCRGGAITATQLPRTTQYGAGSELSEAYETRVRLRMNGERSRPAEMAFGLAHEQVIGQYRNDRSRPGKQPGTRKSDRPSQSDTRGKNRNQYFAHGKRPRLVIARQRRFAAAEGHQIGRASCRE